MPNRHTSLAVMVAALGYFVDVFDLNLFGIVRVASLNDLGIHGDAVLSTGVYLLNMQLIGMLLGGVVWGILGDKRGRISVLFGSITLYSLATFANGFVHSLDTYALLRFIAGVGLAGELGAGVTLVSELLPTNKRGIGTTIIATVGLSGAVVATILGTYCHWRTTYQIGGALGIVLLILRVAVHESGMFTAVVEQNVKRGNLLMLFDNRKRIVRYLSCIGIAVPYWFALSIIILFSPELGAALGMPEVPVAATTMMYWFIGCTAGDLVTGVASQVLRSRKKVIGACLVLAAGLSMFALHVQLSLQEFYLLAGVLGFVYGYWAVFIVTAAEQFGTNLRATVATTTPNFVRGSAALVAILFQYLKGDFGFVWAASIIGGACLLLAFISLGVLRESFANDLDFVER